MDINLNTEDVWSIIHYVRALQRSQNATFEDLPKDEQDKLKWQIMNLDSRSYTYSSNKSNNLDIDFCLDLFY